jgi:hypothetical protein
MLARVLSGVFVFYFSQGNVVVCINSSVALGDDYFLCAA